MDTRKERFQKTIEYGVLWFVLGLLLVYTAAKFIEHPYMGLRWENGGEIIFIFVNGNSDQPVYVGDKLIQIGSVRLTDFQADNLMTLSSIARPRQTIPLVIERGGQQFTISWTIPGPNVDEILDQVYSEFWLPFVFWIIGTFALIALRPKDERWRLIVAFNYLTAIWIGLGGGASFYHILYSPFLLRIAVWFSIPVYIQFHWAFPRPFGKLPAWVSRGGYFVAASFALAECFQLLPKNLYLLGFLVAISTSLLLLIAHAVRQPEARRDLRFLVMTGFIALLPAIVIGMMGVFSTLPGQSGFATIGLPFLPIAYLYAAFRRQLGSQELRVNRFISVYIFFVILLLLIIPLVVLLNNTIPGTGSPIFATILASIVVASASLGGFPAFQSLVERSLLGIPLPHRELPEIYAKRSTTSTSLLKMTNLLKDEIIPTLLVRQFAFLQVVNDSLVPICSTGIQDEKIPTLSDATTLLNEAGKYRPENSSGDIPFSWIRLILPLKAGDDLIGLWLFGHCDPDDLYTQEEIKVIQSLADQTAIALSNIIQTERLRLVYQADINRNEDDRQRLALDLHDSILNEMAALLIKLDDTNLPADFQDGYQFLIHRLREIVSNLRPPMLNYGLKPALEELGESLAERSKDSISVLVEVETDDCRYPTSIENHIFRIMQEGCGNVLKHAQAKKVVISGKLSPDEIVLTLTDDGIGFNPDTDLDLVFLLSNKHFGLAGMIERAELIGGKLEITSLPKAGTKIQLTWSPDRI